MKNILIEDKKAKSKSFFLKQNHNVFDQKLLGLLHLHPAVKALLEKLEESI